MTENSPRNSSSENCKQHGILLPVNGLPSKHGRFEAGWEEDWNCLESWLDSTAFIKHWMICSLDSNSFRRSSPIASLHWINGHTASYFSSYQFKMHTFLLIFWTYIFANRMIPGWLMLTCVPVTCWISDCLLINSTFLFLQKCTIGVEFCLHASKLWLHYGVQSHRYTVETNKKQFWTILSIHMLND